MARSIRFAAVLALAAAMLVGGTVSGDPGGAKLVDASMVGIPAGQASLFPGVTGGGLPWVLDKGDARLFADGRLQVSVKGLVFAAGANAGRNTLSSGRAIVSCNNGGTIIESSPVSFSVPEGDAQVNQLIRLPEMCLGPVVFFAGMTPGGARWFAVTGS
jgi:hypothetical protein